MQDVIDTLHINSYINKQDKAPGHLVPPEKNCPKSKQYTLDMNVFSKGDLSRKDVECFISKGFAKTYSAKVSITMPWLLTIKDEKYKAALGIRSAKHSLFIEQYLSEPIEKIIERNNTDSVINRDDIAEIGHLYSNGKRFTLPLLLVTAVSLFCNDYKYMVFSGTEHVLKLIEKTGVNCSFIAEATKEKLTSPQDNWGTYYETNPKVVFISLIEVMTLINNHPSYSAMFEALNKKIAGTTLRLKEYR